MKESNESKGSAKKNAKMQSENQKTVNKPYIVRFTDVSYYSDYLNKEGNSTSDIDFSMQFKTIEDAIQRAEKGRYSSMEYFEVLDRNSETGLKVVYIRH